MDVVKGMVVSKKIGIEAPAYERHWLCYCGLSKIDGRRSEAKEFGPVVPSLMSPNDEECFACGSPKSKAIPKE